MDWDKTVAAANRGEWMRIVAGQALLAEGESFMDGDTLCIKCGKLTAKGTARYVRITVADQDYVRAERPRRPRGGSQDTSES